MNKGGWLAVLLLGIHRRFQAEPGKVLKCIGVANSWRWRVYSRQVLAHILATCWFCHRWRGVFLCCVRRRVCQVDWTGARSRCLWSGRTGRSVSLSICSRYYTLVWKCPGTRHGRCMHVHGCLGYSFLSTFVITWHHKCSLWRLAAVIVEAHDLRSIYETYMTSREIAVLWYWYLYPVFDWFGMLVHVPTCRALVLKLGRQIASVSYNTSFGAGTDVCKARRFDAWSHLMMERG